MRGTYSIFACLIFSATVYGDPTSIVVKTTVHNDNWFPLSAEEIKAAATDAAQHALSRHGGLKIVDSDAVSDRHGAHGELKLSVTLVNAAQIAKLTAVLQLPECGTLQSSVSQSVRGLDQQGIYRALEQIAQQAVSALDPVAVANHCEPRAAEAIVALYNRAQELKRSGRYDEARTVFEEIVKTATSDQNRWRSMAIDELRFRLPLFEAETRITNIPNGDIIAFSDALNRQMELFSQIVAMNTHDATRVLEAQSRLDQAHLLRKQIAKEIWRRSVARLDTFRRELHIEFVSGGSWPDINAVTALLRVAAPEFDIFRYRIDGAQMELTVTDIRYGDKVSLLGAPSPIWTVQPQAPSFEVGP